MVDEKPRRLQRLQESVDVVRDQLTFLADRLDLVEVLHIVDIRPLKLRVVYRIIDGPIVRIGMVHDQLPILIIVVSEEESAAKDLVADHGVGIFSRFIPG